MSLTPLLKPSSAKSLIFFNEVKWKSLSHVRLFATPWTVTLQAPLSMGTLQARILEWVAMSSSRRSYQPRDRTQVSCNVGGFFTVLSELPGKPIFFIDSTYVLDSSPLLFWRLHRFYLLVMMKLSIIFSFLWISQCYGWGGSERVGAIITIVFSQQWPQASSTLNTDPLKWGAPDCPRSPQGWGLCWCRELVSRSCLSGHVIKPFPLIPGHLLRLTLTHPRGLFPPSIFLSQTLLSPDSAHYSPPPPVGSDFLKQIPGQEAFWWQLLSVYL